MAAPELLFVKTLRMVVASVVVVFDAPMILVQPLLVLAPPALIHFLASQKQRKGVRVEIVPK